MGKEDRGTTSRDRVLTAVARKEPDRVPIDLNGTIVTSLTLQAYENLRAHLGLPPDDQPVISNPHMRTVRVKSDLLELYRIDTRSLSIHAPDIDTQRYLPDGDYYDEFGHRWHFAGHYEQVREHPLKGKEIGALESTPWPDVDDPGRYRGLRGEAERLRTEGKAVIFDIPGLGPFEGACFLREHGDFCTDLYTDPVFAERLLDKVTDTMIAFWERILDQVGDLVDIVAQGDDVGMQTGPFMSVEMYRQFIKPRKRRLFDAIRAKTNAKIFYHSCGGVRPYIPDFIEEGIDILNPVQRSAGGMEIESLKNDFGRELCLWGGAIDVQSQLPFLTPAEIRDEVARSFDILKRNGGFVCFPSHNIQPDVSPDRIDAFFRAALESAAY